MNSILSKCKSRKKPFTNCAYFTCSTLNKRRQMISKDWSTCWKNTIKYWKCFILIMEANLNRLPMAWLKSKHKDKICSILRVSGSYSKITNWMSSSLSRRLSIWFRNLTHKRRKVILTSVCLTFKFSKTLLFEQPSLCSQGLQRISLATRLHP